MNNINIHNVTKIEVKPRDDFATFLVETSLCIV